MFYTGIYMGLSRGFSTVELLITLFVAAGFLIAAYQLYAMVIRDGGHARAQAKATNVAKDYAQRYASTVSANCVPTTLSNQPVTVQGLANATVTVTVTCPNSSIPKLTKVVSTVSYNTPAKTVTVVSGAAAQ